ncbi:MAG: sigma-70 family RNA polymerase sigma factor [Acidobacteriaceae bacterium]
MNWEYAIPQSAASETSQAPGQSMDSEEFEAFYERSARSLWAYLARVSNNAALADDLMQEAYLRFLGATAPGGTWAGAADGEVACRRYLFRIATNLLRDHWRRPSTSSLDEHPEAAFACKDTTAQRDAQAMLGPALQQIRPRDRQILWLAYAEDYSHEEIAEITGLHRTSIRVTLFRARRKMAVLLRQPGSPAKEDA